MILKELEKNGRKNLFNLVDKTSLVNITKYAIYGTHFNIEGTLDFIKISGIKVENVDLLVKDLDGNEQNIKAEFNYSDDGLSFSTFGEINEGIDLENLSENSYYILLKVSYSNSDIKYFSLVNSTEYNNITYYTITKNEFNNKIDIGFEKYNDISYMSLEVKGGEKLPENVYDIALDAGHGGRDKGATSGDYKEAEIVLDYCLKLKTELENMGLKVFLSRDGTEDSKEDTTLTMYDENGRINLLNGSYAKLILSIHINENKYSKSNGGVEVYAPNDCDLGFAKEIANNIVEKANTSFSQNTAYKEEEGVYVKNFRNADIVATESRAKRNGYEPYHVTTSTPYIYVIRETGGISTNAFVDGRNKSFGTNKYYNSNVGIETYQIELGYMAIENDLQNILNNPQGYIDGIIESIKNHYKIGL